MHATMAEGSTSCSQLRLGSCQRTNNHDEENMARRRSKAFIGEPPAEAGDRVDVRS